MGVGGGGTDHVSREIKWSFHSSRITKGVCYNETYQNSFRSAFAVTPVNGSVDLPVAWMITKKVHSCFQFWDVK